MSARLLLLSCSLLTAVAPSTFAQVSAPDAGVAAASAAPTVRRGDAIRSIELTQLSERGPQKMPLYAPEGEPMIVHFWGSSDSVDECVRELDVMSGIYGEVSSDDTHVVFVYTGRNEVLRKRMCSVSFGNPNTAVGSQSELAAWGLGDQLAQSRIVFLGGKSPRVLHACPSRESIEGTVATVRNAMSARGRPTRGPAPSMNTQFQQTLEFIKAEVRVALAAAQPVQILGQPLDATGVLTVDGLDWHWSGDAEELNFLLFVPPDQFPSLPLQDGNTTSGRRFGWQHAVVDWAKSASFKLEEHMSLARARRRLCVASTETTKAAFNGDNRSVFVGMGLDVLSNWTLPAELLSEGEPPALVVTTGEGRIVGLVRIKEIDRRLYPVAVDAHSGRPSSEFERLNAQSAAEDGRLIAELAESIKLNLAELRKPPAPTPSPSEPSGMQQVQSPDGAPK
jgi:hypothetical protein